MPESVTSVLDKLLTFIDKPWKAVTLGLLAILTLVLYTLYEQRAQIAAAVLQSLVTPRLLADVYKQSSAALLRDTRGDYTQLLGVELDHNTFNYLGGYQRNGDVWQLGETPHTIISDATDTQAVAEIIEGHTVCRDANHDSGKVGDRLSAKYDIKRYCVIGVPPVLGVLVGALYVGWHEALNAHDEDDATHVMRHAAMKLADW
jgi:hypothetical protein